MQPLNAPVMKRTLRQTLILAVTAVITLLGFAQCEKGPEEFGQGVMHPDDSISAKYDTSFVMKTQVVPSDSFSTLYYFFSEPEFITNYPNMMLGGYTDRHFGTFKASFVSQIGKTDSINFAGDTLEAVEAVLYFKINESYGEIQAGPINVFKINKGLEITEPYYNTADPLDFYNPEDMISESTVYEGDSIIKINLTKAFADFLTTADDTTMADMSDFRAFMPGIYVEMGSPTSDGYLKKLNITNDTTRLELAVRKEGTTENPDTLEYPISSSSIRFNLFNNDYQTATYPDVNVPNFLNNDPAESDSILLIDGLGGTRAKLTIPPEVKEKFAQDSNFLARAEIELRPTEQYNDFLFPESVAMYTYSSDTNYVDISNNQFFNGQYNEETNTFSCNVTNFIQAYINGDIGNEIYLHVKDYRFEPGLLIVSGSGNKSPINLRIKYFKP
jgi:hypothetical protein